MAAVTISKIRYKRANSQMMERIPAPFTFANGNLFLAAFCIERNAEYTPNRVMRCLQLQKRDDIFQNIFHCLHFVQIILKCTYFGKKYSPAARPGGFKIVGFHDFYDLGRVNISKIHSPDLFIKKKNK